MKYLARQGQAMQGDTDDESNFIQLLTLRGKDQPLLLKWLERKENRYPSHDIQNEITAIIFYLFIYLFIATTHTDNTTLHDYLSYATITTLHYTAQPTYRNCTYIAVILLN